MALPRGKYVQEEKVGIYHCFSRCVRRAFLYGFDPYSGRDYSHRKAWLVDRLRDLTSIFAVEVCDYSIMTNHYHTILRTRPDIADDWSDQEVASRWLTLCPQYYRSKKASIPIDEQIRNLALYPDRIAILRKRLSSLSWFMGRLNEFIARAANKEDGVKGRFWESRFKCQALLDVAAIAACMVYVDLNPIRSGLASTPEESDFTAIQQRIRAWHRNKLETHTPASSNFDNNLARSNWLCPISSQNNQGGILPMTETEYFELVDRSGRLVRSDKVGSIDADLAPILLRIGAKPEAWSETVSCFGDKFNLVAGQSTSLRNFSNQLGRHWFKGIVEAQKVFAPSPQQ